MMDGRRLGLFVALFVILLLIWQKWVEQHRPTPPRPESAPTADAPSDVPSPPQAQTPETPPQRVRIEPLPRAERIVVMTDLLRVEIDTHGGDLRRAELLKYPVRIDADEPFRLMDDGEKTLFVAQSGLIAKERALPNHRTRYRAERTRYELARGADRLEVPLHWRGPDGVEYIKRYVFHRDRYVVDVEYVVRNSAAEPWRGYFYAQFLRTPAEAEQQGLFTLPSYIGGAIYSPDEKFEKIDFDEMAEGGLQADVRGGWIAMLQHYFVGAWLPSPEARARFYARAVDPQRYNLGYKLTDPLVVAPGDEGRIGARIYVGPKEQNRLRRTADGLVLTVDYGWLTPVAAPLFWILKYIHRFVGNWGWAIVILTVLIKLAFYPLSAASYKSMARMKKLQPRLKSLKERYGDDRQKLNEAMMELYRSEKVNPLGGCLPILVQIPVFIALYWVLLESVELRQADFVLWLRDLSAPDPYFVLPVVMGLSMFAQQWLNPSPLDPVQKKLMMALPVIFTVFFLFFPAGLVLYWVVNNVLSIAQQWHITRRLGIKH